jgi:hypothetical protein
MLDPMLLTALVRHKTPVRERMAAEGRTACAISCAEPLADGRRLRLSLSLPPSARDPIRHRTVVGGASAQEQISSFAADGMFVWTGKDMLAAAEVRDRIARIICRAQRTAGRVRRRRAPVHVPDSVIDQSRAL